MTFGIENKKKSFLNRISLREENIYARWKRKDYKSFRDSLEMGIVENISIESSIAIIMGGTFFLK